MIMMLRSRTTNAILAVIFLCFLTTIQQTASAAGGGDFVKDPTENDTDDADYDDDGDDDQVHSIPNFDGDICWNHYSGYLNATNDHKLFYWYHEAAVGNPEEKPLVLWLNGGPGCSSLGGMWTELGPFVLDKDLNITLNPYSFNKVANILFLEQPAGVGFSYPNVPTNDTMTAIDTVEALRYFFQYKHPELIGREFYVMGESYGGHYVPNTVQQIQRTNKEVPIEQRINIRGFAVGNGYTDWQLDFNANVANGRYHALTSQTLLDAAYDACDQGNYARCFWPREDVQCPDVCGNAVMAATIHAEDNTIDIYDIYNDVCLDDTQERLETQLTTFMGYRRKALQKYYMKRQQQQEQDEQQREQREERERDLRAIISPVFPTCIDAYTEKYLNLRQVQKAIHVDPDTIPNNGRWSDCGNVEYDFNYESELPNYRQWVEDGNLEILIYNGDTDYILSHMGNSAWINDGLKLNKLQEWTMWRGSDGQVAGYYEKYQTNGSPLTFLTVKGAGHMVPKDRPRHALDMFETFLNGGGKYDEVKRRSSTTTPQPLCSSVSSSAGSATASASDK